MQIDPVSPQIVPPPPPPPEEPPQEEPQSSDVPAPEPEPLEGQSGEDGELKGVIRNLLNGHFKGVAGIRLRISHYDELKEIFTESIDGTFELTM